MITHEKQNKHGWHTYMITEKKDNAATRFKCENRTEEYLYRSYSFRICFVTFRRRSNYYAPVDNIFNYKLYFDGYLRIKPAGKLLQVYIYELLLKVILNSAEQNEGAVRFTNHVWCVGK